MTDKELEKCREIIKTQIIVPKELIGEWENGNNKQEKCNLLIIFCL